MTSFIAREMCIHGCYRSKLKLTPSLVSLAKHTPQLDATARTIACTPVDRGRFYCTHENIYVQFATSHERCKNNHRPARSRVSTHTRAHTRDNTLYAFIYCPIEHDRYKLDLRVPIVDPIFTRLSTPLCNLDNWLLTAEMCI